MLDYKPNPPFTEEHIERVVERRSNTLDKQLMDGKLTQDAYDANCAAITGWADREYARAREAR